LQEDEISGTADEIAGLQDTRNKRLAEIAKLEQELAAKRQAFDDLPPPVDNKAAIEAVGAEGRQLSDQVSAKATPSGTIGASSAPCVCAISDESLDWGPRRQSPCCPLNPCSRPQANEVEAEARNLETRQTHLRNDLIRIKRESGGGGTL
jgi:hypothetical protein